MKQQKNMSEKTNFCDHHNFDYSIDPELGCPWCEIGVVSKERDDFKARFQKAKEWNALTEVELGLLRGLVKDMEDDTKDLMTALLELCEKMESGISGRQETNRARALLEKLA